MTDDTAPSPTPGEAVPRPEAPPADPAGRLTREQLLALLPTDRLYAPEMDMWVKLEEDSGLARLGPTHFVASHGQFMYFTPRGPETMVVRDRSLGVMETAKTAVAIHSPVTCRVVAVNEAVAADVSAVERDPYGEGWLFLVEATNLDHERPFLLDAEAYAEWLEPRAEQKTRERPVSFDEFGEDLRVDPNQGY